LAACLLPFAKLREWQVWGNLNPYLNDGGGSLAVDQRQPLNDCFLSKENSSWANNNFSTTRSAKKITKHGCTDQTN